jgi:hypothetical protein
MNFSGDSAYELEGSPTQLQRFTLDQRRRRHTENARNGRCNIDIVDLFDCVRPMIDIGASRVENGAQVSKVRIKTVRSIKVGNGEHRRRRRLISSSRDERTLESVEIVAYGQQGKYVAVILANLRADSPAEGRIIGVGRNWSRVDLVEHRNICRTISIKRVGILEALEQRDNFLLESNVIRCGHGPVRFTILQIDVNIGSWTTGYGTSLAAIDPGIGQEIIKQDSGVEDLESVIADHKNIALWSSFAIDANRVDNMLNQVVRGSISVLYVAGITLGAASICCTEPINAPVNSPQTTNVPAERPKSITNVALSLIFFLSRGFKPRKDLKSACRSQTDFREETVTNLNREWTRRLSLSREGKQKRAQKKPLGSGFSETAE